MEILADERDFTTNIKRAFNGIDRNYTDYKGIVVAGTHTPDGLDWKIGKIKEARENGIPFLGICHGHQLAAIEYARNVLGIKDATSEEFGTGTYVVKKLPELKVGIHEVDGRMESFWNNYEVDLPGWVKPDHFFTSQFHPEYAENHPLLVNFLTKCKQYSSNMQKV